MECSFYDMSLTRIGAISTWVSMVWEDCYNTEGKFQIELQYQKDLFDLIQPDVYCGITGHDTLMLIKSVQVKGGKIVANGFSACTRILNDRVSTRVISNQNAEAALLSLISAMQAWPRVYAGEAQGLTDIYAPQISDGALLKYALAISAETDMGFRMRHDPAAKKLIFECYKPALNLNARYSTKYGNMGDITYSCSGVNSRMLRLWPEPEREQIALKPMQAQRTQQQSTGAKCTLMHDMNSRMKGKRPRNTLHGFNV